MFLSRLVAVLSTGLSGAALVEIAGARPTFCGFESGCDAVIFSPYGHPWGVPLPVVGIVAFGGFLTLSLIGAPTALLLGGATLGGASGLLLLVLQICVLRQMCVLCVLVDLGAMSLALAAYVDCRRNRAVMQASWRARGIWSTVGVLAVLAPWFWAWSRPTSAPPDAVRACWSPGIIAVVEVTDFECGHCRAAHAVLAAFAQSHGNQVRWIRLPAAMPRHAGARLAARAYLAAEAQGQGLAMAEALFARSEHAAADCRQLAQSLALDLDRYDQVVNDSALDARLDATNAWASTAGRGLPLIWVHDQLFCGVPTRTWLEGALRRAQRFAWRQ